ncbi:adenosylcobinamide-GDP ribazoletransferase [Thiohalobacter sp. IOR34]|uniref:adenosylcobinamide-GDP ribazoletransferase n=1 Tax=Thiohalobacter sp. IOR34 TaxID=3057176 RepID=UPI00339D59A4
MRGFWIALQFLTRLPVPALGQLGREDIARSLVCYPLVGLLLGLILWGLAAATAGLGPLPAAALLLLVWTALTGGLHLDGLGDCADAWLGGHGDAERSLAIMKDPHAGPAAVIAIVLLLLFKFAALATLLAGTPLWVLLLVPVLGRAAVIGLLRTAPYVRPGGLGEPLSEAAAEGGVIALLATAGGVLLLGGGSGLLWLVCAALAVAAVRHLALRRIGGVTGDVLGAAVEISEAAVLLGMLI